MSEREINYFKLLTKFYDIKVKFFDIKEDIDEYEGKIANFQKMNSIANKERQEQLIKINKLKEDSKADKALKLEMKMKKKEVVIANNKAKISEVLKKSEKKKSEFQKIRTELENTESQLKTEFPDKFSTL